MRETGLVQFHNLEYGSCNRASIGQSFPFFKLSKIETLLGATLMGPDGS